MLTGGGPPPGSIGDQASAFLNDMLGGDNSNGHHPGDADAGTTGAGVGQPPGRSDGAGLTEYVPMTWLVTVDDRVTIRRALTAAMEQWGLNTSAESLAALARDFLNQKANR